MTSTDIAVSVQNLTKSYGAFAALDGVTFDIERGETFALLGPNGAGKSTTIEILEGYRDRSGGEARVLGVDPQHGGLEWKARLGIVLQSSGESGNVTVREQLTQFAGFYPNARSVNDVIAAVGLEEKAGTRIKNLSGGQRRRVDVALGVIGRPELLFLDEPTTGFDPEARRQFWELIHELKREGTTILLTTHYLDEAAQLSDRAAVVAGGKLIDIGPVGSLGSAEARVPIVRWLENGVSREVRSHDPGATVADLVRRIGEPQNLEVVRPSLEDIYLGLVADSGPASHGESSARVAANTLTTEAAIAGTSSKENGLA
ncbi:ABC transporter ATP-binding protein [Subtercola frigoramans]|uniref:ABC-2 type transport system ATP-binding protein n=1 Tax=Subtercola frigoramans TaxID=120298 RepID=A0ABS2L252_9MICO|nr:ABC transporter ATP-binding protein [Subtercola frigoramans]MBM7471021.1 ABC-2 type transport system ATP-binding protein [Subtercola frigoramans]